MVEDVHCVKDLVARAPKRAKVIIELWSDSDGYLLILAIVRNIDVKRISEDIEENC